MRRLLLLVFAVTLATAACGPSPAGTDAPSASHPPLPTTGATLTTAPGELHRVGTMTITRAAHTATTLPDGRVLVTGGCTKASCEAITASTELFDPSTGLSQAGPDMLEPRVGHVAVRLPDGRILLIGGFGASTVLRSTELLDPETGLFSAGPVLTEPRADVGAFVLADGSVLVAGGFDGAASIATAELLDPAITAFRGTGSLTAARSSHAGALLPDGKVLVLGGGTGGTADEVHASAEIYDPVTGAWTATGIMSTPRHKTAAVALADGRVLVVGGSDDRDSQGRYRSAEIYDPATGTFAPAGDMSAARYKIIDAVVRLLDGRVLVAGGARGAEIFDPAANQFAPVRGDANTDYGFAAVARLANGSVVITGGYDPTITLTDQVLLFVP